MDTLMVSVVLDPFHIIKVTFTIDTFSTVTLKGMDTDVTFITDCVRSTCTTER